MLKMTLNDLLPELLKLNRDEMVEAVEILKRQIVAKESSQIVDGAVYEVWSPTITPETARILYEVLQEDQEKHD
jgi:hypothetical protein